MTTSSSLVDQILDDLDQFGGKLGLEAITRLLDVLGDPQDDVPSVVVAGTNGKGSTCALLAAMGHCAGYRTGLYTSPHLERPEERIRIDGRAIESDDLAPLLEEVVERNHEIFGVRPSYFEAMTAAARLHFSRSRCDLAVVEVGLGGRLDATNVGTPLVAVVTPVSLDHQLQLGDTLERIATEKAGIFRPGVPVVAWCRPSQVGATLRARAEVLSSELIDASERAEVLPLAGVGEFPAPVEVTTSSRRYSIELHLLGRHQLPNLALAVLTAEVLGRGGFPALDGQAIERGAQRCRWPGRLEEVQLPDGPTVLLDGAHNEAGANALAALLDGLESDVDLLFGCLATKDVGRILPPLAERARRVILTMPRSGTPHEPASLAAMLQEQGVSAQLRVEPDLDAALDLALSGGPGGRTNRLLVAGSLYLVGDVRQWLHDRWGVPPRASQVDTG